jgi:hypothetical protein
LSGQVEQDQDELRSVREGPTTMECLERLHLQSCRTLPDVCSSVTGLPGEIALIDGQNVNGVSPTSCAATLSGC